MYGFDGGELEDVYEKLSEDYRACEERADAVRDRIDKVERIAADLFKEWESEIATIENVKLSPKAGPPCRTPATGFPGCSAPWPVRKPPWTRCSPTEGLCALSQTQPQRPGSQFAEERGGGH
jgi:hypothetical protein